MKNIKTVLTITILILTANIVAGQSSDNELKNFRFGLKVTPSVNWYKPEGKIIAANGAVIKFGGGLVMEFQLAKVISIQTGVQVDLNGGKLKYNNGDMLTSVNSNSVSYLYSISDEIILSDNTPFSATSHEKYQLNSRTYNISYITIPLTIKMKTKEIGMFTYYGQFGINNSIRWKATADDEVQKITGANLGTSDSKKNIEVTKDVSLYTASLNMGLGAEMNLSGTTALTFGLNYLLGFTNTLKNNSDYLTRRVNDANGATKISKMPQEIKSNSIVLTIGILF